MEQTKISLIKAIQKNSGYTYKEIENKYTEELNKYPGRVLYYAKKHARSVLQGWLISLKKEKGQKLK